MNLADFNRELQQWPDEVMAQHAAPMQRNILTELADGLIEGTPVLLPIKEGSGHAKRNWRVDLYRAYGTTELSGADPTGALAKAEGRNVITRITDKPVDFATISNPVDYMDALANGSSKQAPAGWIDQVVASVAAKYARVR
jgi:hypothetical protein